MLALGWTAIQPMWYADWLGQDAQSLLTHRMTQSGGAPRPEGAGPDQQLGLGVA
jgi:hypothetical protein